MKKTYKAYDEAFCELKKIAQEQDVFLAPSLALTDFERASRKALSFHFPGIKLRGCYFHYKQAIGRWIFKHGYKRTYTQNLFFKKWFRKLASLAVVPLDQFDEAYNIIKSSQPTEINVTPILKYFESTWINGSFPVTDWNYFGVYVDRTNNNVEVYNKIVNSKLKSSHPTLYKFIDFIKDEENRMQISLYQSDKKPYYIGKQTKAVI